MGLQRFQHRLFRTSLCLGGLSLMACQPQSLTPTTPPAGPTLTTAAGTPTAHWLSFTQGGVTQNQVGQLQMEIQWPQGPTVQPGSDFGIQTIPASTVRLRVRISGGNQPTHEENLQRPVGSLSSSYRLIFLALPSGSNRLIEVDAFDASDTLVATGQARNVTIQPMQFNQQRITLTPISALQPTPPPSSGGGGGGGGGSNPPPPINFPPVISGITPDLSLSGANYQGTLTATASDPENANLSYTWSASAGSFTQDTGAEAQWSGPAGTHTFTVNVSDGVHTSTSSSTLTLENQTPGISDIQISGLQETSAGQHSATFTAVATDPEDQPLSYLWSISAGNLDPTNQNPTTWSSPTQNTVDATYTATVTVSDGHSSQSFSKNFTAHNNQAPLMNGIQSNITESSFNVFNGSLTASASDLENDTLSYTWIDDAQQPILQSLSGGTVSLKSNTPNGTYQLQVKANDGKRDSVSLPYTLVLASGNLPPSITGMSKSISYSNGAHNGSLSATVTDPENRTLSYQWSFVGNNHGAQLSNSTSLNPGFSGPEGSYTLRLQVTDSSVAPTQVTTQDLSFSLSDPNQAPVITGVTPSITLNNGIYSGTLAVSATDADNDPLSYTWSVLNGGSTLGNSTGQSVNWSAGAGTHRVQVIAHDGTTSSAPYVYETTLQVNQAPQITGIDVDNNLYILSSTSRQRNLTVNATDPENAALSYQWRVLQGTPAGSFYSAPTFPNAPLQTLDSTSRTVAYRAEANVPYVVEVQVSDGSQISTYSRNILLGNNSPYVSSTQYSVTCAGNGAYTVPITLSFADPDNHPITGINWSVSAGSLSTGTNTQKTWTIPSAGNYTLNVSFSDPYSTNTASLNLQVSGCP